MKNRTKRIIDWFVVGFLIWLAVVMWSDYSHANIQPIDHDAFSVQSDCGFYPTYAALVADDKNNGIDRSVVLNAVAGLPENDKNAHVAIIEYVYESGHTDDPESVKLEMYNLCIETMMGN